MQSILETLPTLFLPATDLPDKVEDSSTRPRGYKAFFMLNSTEHEIFPAHNC